MYHKHNRGFKHKDYNGTNNILSENEHIVNTSSNMTVLGNKNESTGNYSLMTY